MYYYVTYCATAEMDDVTYTNVVSLNSDDMVELEEVILHCTTLECEAKPLFDEQGFRRGRVHADGTYTLQSHARGAGDPAPRKGVDK